MKNNAQENISRAVVKPSQHERLRHGEQGESCKHEERHPQSVLLIDEDDKRIMPDTPKDADDVTGFLSFVLRLKQRLQIASPAELLYAARQTLKDKENHEKPNRQPQWLKLSAESRQHKRKPERHRKQHKRIHRD